MAQKPSIAKGTRDFCSEELQKRDYIFQTIKNRFKNFGFQPIETPSFENSSTLMGKYGEEGDRLIFKILNSGDYLKKADASLLDSKNSEKLTKHISEKALRYDLTVPFARYVVQHRNEIQLPFKRYQIQPVWRADRPQKGRFREFYQCDADVVGSKSLWQEVEFIQLYDGVFTDLKLDGVTVKVNHRKILSGIAEVIGAEDKLIDFTVALDKLDKIGKEGVEKEMLEKGIPSTAIEKASLLFELQGSFTEKLNILADFLKDSEKGLKGVEDLRFLNQTIQSLGLQTVALDLEVTLARGLNYYTGAIFEVAAPKEVPMGSIGGGGRYDDLTSIFGLKDLSGVGISFGLDRIYLVLEALNKFPEQIQKGTEVLFLNFGEKEALYAYKAILKLREVGISTELYPDNAKMKKQMLYANKKQYPYVILTGTQEIENNTYTVKNMQTGEQESLDLEGLIDIVSA